jgi:hypothetical protein
MSTTYVTPKMRSEAAFRRAHAWLLDLAAACGLIPAPFAFAVPSVQAPSTNGSSRRLEHPT